MTLQSLLQSLHDSPLSDTIREGALLFPAIESVHVICIAMVIGTICIVDLRLIGISAHRRSAARLIHEMLPYTLAGFAVAVVTGALMFASNPITYFDNTNFRNKMVLMAAAGINMAVFHLLTQRNIDQWDEDSRPPVGARAAGLISLLLWGGVTFFGRMVGFTLH